jgi:guanylate kinase
VIRARGILLYGPPASGKSTITRELAVTADSKTQLFKRLKVGAHRRDEYRMTTADVLDDLRSRGEIIWENRRYGAVYATDRPELLRMTQAGLVPVVHVGQVEAIHALRNEPVHWLTVALTCPRGTAIQRIVHRATGDTSARIAAWDDSDTLTAPDLRVDTSTCTPQEAGTLIAMALETSQMSGVIAQRPLRYAVSAR